MKRITLISFFSFLVAILIVFSASFALARNKVLSLDGDGDYVEISDAISLQLPDSLTMEAWILQRAVHSVTPFVIYKRFAYGFAVGNNTIYHFFYRDESSHVDKFIPVTIERGIWNHIAVTLDNDGTVKAYFNGSLIDTDFRVVPINITGILNIGRAPFGAYYFDGLIDELRIWNVARTQEEIQGNMDKPLENPKSELNLVGYWNFDEGTADDLSQYENNGELQGDAYIADVIYVSSEYGSPGGDGTKEDPYDTIQRGINEAGWKDIVQALPGTYTENINLRSDLILLGSGIENTTITAASGNIVTANNVHNVSFSGFTIDGQGSADNGIVCSGTTSEMEISNNIITDATTGFQCLDSVEVSIEENTIYQNITHGIYCAGTSVVKIGKNSTEANGSYGIMCEGQTNTSITENFVCQNWRGIFCGQDAVIVIEENEIQANDYAIHCVGSTQVDILSNHIANNRNGIDCHNAPKVNIAENLIHSNNWAILGYDSSYLLIARNIIKHNLEGGIYCGEYWDDSFELIIGGSLVNANYIIDNTWRAVWNRTEKVINATYNYWGTTDESEISAMMINEGDGSIIFKPFINTLDEIVADTSGDGTVSAYDAALILQFVVGLIDTFPISIPQSPEQTMPRNYTISLPSLTAHAKKHVQAPVAINDANGLFAGGIILKYDPTVLKAVDVLPTTTLNGSYWKANTKLNGEIRFAFAFASVSEDASDTTKSLFMVEFEVLPHTTGKVSPLILDKVHFSESQSINKINGSVVILPERTILLQNYPNPFNPETWIPYQLATDSPVMISIYNVKGNLIRVLRLGNQNAGIYMTKDKAAYWDGKDSVGEKVASGVYFYTIRTGQFQATRRMVIMN